VREPRRETPDRRQPGLLDEARLGLPKLAQRTGQVGGGLLEPPLRPLQPGHEGAGHRPDCEIEDHLQHLLRRRRRIVGNVPRRVGGVGETDDDRGREPAAQPVQECRKNDRQIVEAPVDVVLLVLMGAGQVVGRGYPRDREVDPEQLPPLPARQGHLPFRSNRRPPAARPARASSAPSHPTGSRRGAQAQIPAARTAAALRYPGRSAGQELPESRRKLDAVRLQTVPQPPRSGQPSATVGRPPGCAASIDGRPARHYNVARAATVFRGLRLHPLGPWG